MVPRDAPNDDPTRLINFPMSVVGSVSLTLQSLLYAISQAVKPRQIELAFHISKEANHRWRQSTTLALVAAAVGVAIWVFERQLAGISL
jgi:hypothetical protein